MKKELQYALVTSSALPNEIQESEHYIDLEKEQWLDLIDYSTEVVKTDEDQEILFLIVAKGTSDQQDKDDTRRAAKDLEKVGLLDNVDKLKDELSELDKASCECRDEKSTLQTKHDLLQEQLDDVLGSKEGLRDELSRLKESERLEEERDQRQAAASASKKKDVRKKSISLFNALYNK